ncbi:MAG: UDP-glucuronic acid decarboxylase family protein [Thermoplasmatota archaeon]
MALHLVAGGSGFVGSHLCERLVQGGDEVISVDSHITGRPGNLPRMAKLEKRVADVSLEATAQEAVGHRKVTHVWHLASPASPPDYLKAPLETLRAGSRGTENLLRLAHRHGARFLLASTSEVYGDPLVNPQPESYWGNVNPVGVRSVYDEAKRFAEAMTMAYHRANGTRTHIARIFNTYGPRMRLDDGRVVPNFVGQALRNEELTIYGDGSQTRSFCYVDDLVEGLVRLMASDEAEPVNLGNPNEMTVSAFADALEVAVGRPLPRTHKPLPEDDPKRRRPDISRAREKLGWEPRVPLAQGLAKTYSWFKEHRT